MPPGLGSAASMSGQYEPEGIYLSLPLEGPCRILQGWGAHPEFHGQFMYHGVRVKGHPGLDLAAAPNSLVLAADAGRVSEISVEPNGFGRYLKLEHRWGESLYTNLGEILVDAGQNVVRGQKLARTEVGKRPYPPHLHFAIRLSPFNRFDGWGGFSDPLPYLFIAEMEESAGGSDAELGASVALDEATLPRLLDERPGVRRP